MYYCHSAFSNLVYRVTKKEHEPRKHLTLSYAFLFFSCFTLAAKVNTNLNAYQRQSKKLPERGGPLWQLSFLLNREIYLLLISPTKNVNSFNSILYIYSSPTPPQSNLNPSPSLHSTCIHIFLFPIPFSTTITKSNNKKYLITCPMMHCIYISNYCEK